MGQDHVRPSRQVQGAVAAAVCIAAPSFAAAPYVQAQLYFEALPDSSKPHQTTTDAVELTAIMCEKRTD